MAYDNLTIAQILDLPTKQQVPIRAKDIATGEIETADIVADFIILTEVEAYGFNFIPTAVTALGRVGFRTVGTHIHHGAWLSFWKREIFIFLQRAPRNK